MKKTIIASSLAVGLGLVAGNVSHADASVKVKLIKKN